MKNIKENVNVMMYRNNTHLASIDVVEPKILTVKKCIYAEDVNVNGRKTNGLFMSFIENVKDMKVNTTNKKIIVNILISGGLSLEKAVMSENWKGLKIELYSDPNVTMKGERTGGIRVRKNNPIPNVSSDKAIGLIKKCKSLEDLKKCWETLSIEEKKLPEVVAEKETKKSEVSND